MLKKQAARIAFALRLDPLVLCMTAASEASDMDSYKLVENTGITGQEKAKGELNKR